MFNLNEDNQTVEQLMDYINEKILILRNNNKIPKELIDELIKTYGNIFNEWMEKYYIQSKEIGEEETTRLQNNAVDFISMLNKL